MKLFILLESFPTVPERALPVSMAERCRVRDIIAATISEEIACAKTADGEYARRNSRPLREGYLSADEIKLQAKEGKIALQTKSEIRSTPRFEEEIEKACRSFETGTTQVVIDGRRAESLDDEVILSPESQVRFIRLLPMRGG